MNTIEAITQSIQQCFKKFSLDVEIEKTTTGRRLYELDCVVKGETEITKVLGLIVNLEYALAISPISITPQSSDSRERHLTIVVPKLEGDSVSLWTDMVQTETFKNEFDNKCWVPIGETISGDLYGVNLVEVQHILMGGTTGSGKSNLIHVIINSLLQKNSPNDIEFVLIDPKRVELTLYEKIPHLIDTSVIVDSQKATDALRMLVEKLEHRLATDKETVSKMPRTVLIIDEISDLMVSEFKESIEEDLMQLIEQGHTVGIHLILSTSRLGDEIYPEQIRKSIKTHIAGNTASQSSSYFMLNRAGAERLLGKGDMLIRVENEDQPTRFQACCISDEEIRNNISALKTEFK